MPAKLLSCSFLTLPWFFSLSLSLSHTLFVSLPLAASPPFVAHSVSFSPHRYLHIRCPLRVALYCAIYGCEFEERSTVRLRQPSKHRLKLLFTKVPRPRLPEASRLSEAFRWIPTNAVCFPLGYVAVLHYHSQDYVRQRWCAFNREKVPTDLAGGKAVITNPFCASWKHIFIIINHQLGSDWYKVPLFLTVVASYRRKQKIIYKICCEYEFYVPTDLKLCIA